MASSYALHVPVVFPNCETLSLYYLYHQELKGGRRDEKSGGLVGRRGETPWWPQEKRK